METGSIKKRKFLGICCTYIIVYPKGLQTFFFFSRDKLTSYSTWLSSLLVVGNLGNWCIELYVLCFHLLWFWLEKNNPRTKLMNLLWITMLLSQWIYIKILKICKSIFYVINICLIDALFSIEGLKILILIKIWKHSHQIQLYFEQKMQYFLNNNIYWIM